MEPLKVGVIGTGSIAQVVHLPILNKMDDVELVAICDIDDSKIHKLVEKFHIPSWYRTPDQMIKSEQLDAVHICTSSHYHFPMSYLALKNGIHVLVEKPVALNASDARKLYQTATDNQLTMMIGMQNRFRDDVQTLKELIINDELGDIFYIKTGWLKRWAKLPLQSWQTKKEFSGGGVLIDLGIQLIDLALYLTELPEIKTLRLYDYTLNPSYQVEDAALAVMETKSGMTITVETSWRMHLENDQVYTHIFGTKGSAYLDPLRIHKDLHGNLVNVTPMQQKKRTDRFKAAYETEIRHFMDVIRGKEENQSSAEDAAYIMQIIDALYESAKRGKPVGL